MAQDINKVDTSEKMLDADYFLASIDGKLRRFKKEDLLKALLLKSGGTMTGAINMNGHAMTGIPDAEEDTDALALAFAKTLFAPSGYGYGGEIPDFFKVTTDTEMYTKLDEMLAKMPVGSARNVYFAHEGSHVVNGVATLGGQGYLFGVLSKQLSTGSGDYAHLEMYSYLGRRYQIDKVLTWGAVEFNNPAMGLGVEYRTTERHNGKVVYAGAKDMVRIQAYTSRGHLLPIGQFIKDDTSSGYFAYTATNAGSNGVYVFTDTRSDGFGNGSYKVYLKVWYTKD